MKSEERLAREAAGQRWLRGRGSLEEWSCVWCGHPALHDDRGGLSLLCLRCIGDAVEGTPQWGAWCLALATYLVELADIERWRATCATDSERGEAHA